jgi:hypothetical protein
VCDYLEAVDKGNSVDALRRVAREYDDETMTAVANARADVLELLATLAQ